MPTPKEIRLATDFEKIRKLVNESGGTLALRNYSGVPPTYYLIQYHCPSWTGVENEIPKLGHIHQVEIHLSSSYPLAKGSAIARVTSPIFNPHVYMDGRICLGNQWTVTETLDNLVLRIGAILQLDPKVLDYSSPANSFARDEVLKVSTKLPLGTVLFKKALASTSRITWQ